MRRLGFAVLAILLCAAAARAELRRLLVDGSSAQGRIGFHTEAVLGPQQAPGSGQDPWEPLADTPPDRVVVPISLGPDALSPEAWNVLPDWRLDPSDPLTYAFEDVDRVIRSAIEHSASVTVRLVPRLPAPSGAKVVEVTRRLFLHLNAQWASGHEFGVQRWQICPTGEESSDAGGSETIHDTVARSLQALDPASEISACVTSGPRFAFQSILWAPAAAMRDAYDAYRIAQTLRGRLDRLGLASTSIALLDSSIPFSGARSDPGLEAAFQVASLIYLLGASLESMPLSAESGAANSRGRKQQAAVRALEQMMKTPRLLSAQGTDNLGFAVLAGCSDDQKRIQILVANYERAPGTISLRAEETSAAPGLLAVEPPPPRTIVYADNDGYDMEITNLPWGDADFGVYRYRIDAESDLDLIWTGGGRGGSLRLTRSLPPPGVELIVLQQEDSPVRHRLPRRRDRRQ